MNFVLLCRVEAYRRKEKNNMDKLLAGLMLVVGALALALLLALILAYPTMLLWNVLMPSLFGLKTISYLQALGLMILSNLLFGKSSSSSSK
jgi:hypothetical protein